MRKETRWSLIVAALLLMSVVKADARTPYHVIRYTVTLSAVERGGIRQEVKGGALAYEDDLIRIDWAPTEIQLDFRLTNRGESTLRLRWDEASYVGPNGQSDKLLHNTDFRDRTSPKTPTVIMRGATFSGFAKPSSGVWWQESPSPSWFFARLIETPPASRDVESLRKQLPTTPPRMMVLLPIEVGGKVTEYIFEFTAVGAVEPLGR